MISELAKGDIELLEEQGYRVPFEYAVRLNALGLRIKYDPQCELASLPRLVVMEGTVLKQPSIRQQLIIDDCCRVLGDDDHTYLAACAYVLGHPDVEESEFGDPAGIAKKIKKWLSGFRDTTADQLETAVVYLIYGMNPATGEEPVYMTDKDEKNSRQWDCEGGERSLALRMYLESAALGIDSPAALRATSPQLAAMIERAFIIRGCGLKDQEKKLVRDYYVTLDSIRNALRERAEAKTEEKAEETERNDG